MSSRTTSTGVWAAGGDVIYDWLARHKQLARHKHKYDPANLFRRNQNVRPKLRKS